MSDEDDYQYSEGSDEEEYAIADDDDNNMEWNAVENPNAAPMSWNKSASSIGGEMIILSKCSFYVPFFWLCCCLWRLDTLLQKRSIDCYVLP